MESSAQAKRSRILTATLVGSALAIAWIAYTWWMPRLDSARSPGAVSARPGPEKSAVVVLEHAVERGGGGETLTGGEERSRLAADRPPSAGPTPRLEGWVETPPGYEGHPAVFVFDPNRQPIGRGACDPDGSFRVALEGGRHFVVAAIADRLAPVTIELELEEGESVVQRTFTLDEGAVVSGTVLEGGEPVSSLTRVDARRAGIEDEDPNWHGVAWSDGEIVQHDRRAFTDAQGRFRIPGLTPGDYRLTAVPQRRGRSLTHSVTLGSGTALANVVAPADGVQLELPYRHVLVEVRAGGEPLDGATVLLGTPVRHARLGSLEEERLQGSRTGVDGDGRCGLTFDPSIDYRLRVERVGYGTKVLRMSEAPVDAAGTLVVEMEASYPPSHVLLHVSCDTGPPPEVLSVSIEGLDERFTLVREVRLGPTGFLLEDVPRGDLNVWIRARAPEGGEYFHVPKNILLRVRGDRVLERDVTLEHGGRIHMRATGFEGVLERPRWFVRDADDRVIGVVLEERGGWMPGELKRIREPLPAGTYKIKFAATGFVAWRSEFAVRAGEVSEVEIALEAE